MKIPQQVSESTKRRNPHLYSYATGIAPTGQEITIITKPKKRLRQSTKPLMNKLEQEWFDYIYLRDRKISAQSITFRLANGLRYTPDVFCFDYPSLAEFDRPTAWEVKGKWFTDDANAKLKMFATAYPEISVILAWKQDGKWQTQRVLP